MNLNIIAFSHHRNGICGAPFDVVLFEDDGPDASRKVAILFEEKYHCAVLDVAKLAAGDIAFASNSWRGDSFEQSLRKEVRYENSLTIDSDPERLRNAATDLLEALHYLLEQTVDSDLKYGVGLTEGEEDARAKALAAIAKAEPPVKHPKGRPDHE
jgi:hypothetical protein